MVLINIWQSFSDDDRLTWISCFGIEQHQHRALFGRPALEWPSPCCPVSLNGLPRMRCQRVAHLNWYSRRGRAACMVPGVRILCVNLVVIAIPKNGMRCKTSPNASTYTTLVIYGQLKPSRNATVNVLVLISGMLKKNYIRFVMERKHECGFLETPLSSFRNET